MLDLSLLRDHGNFSVTAGPPRFALVHHGFRTTQVEIMDRRRSKFSPRYASLGLLNLARSLQVDFENGRIPYAPELRYFDEDCYEDDDDMARALAEWLRPAKARFILAGIYTLAVERTAALLTRMDPTAFCIVAGGAHPTVAPQVDYAHIVVRGEGGVALRHIVNNLLQPSFGEGPEARGICFQLDGNPKTSGPAFDNSLASIPPPAFAFELCQPQAGLSEPLRERWWKAVGNSAQIYICTQSCRARCTFCSTYLIHGRLVSRPVDFIRADLDYMVDEFGHDCIHFQDDDLLQHEQFDQLMDLLAARGVAWTCNARSEFITAALARQMFAAGCRRVFLGVESLDQRSLDYYRKATTVAMNQVAVRELDAAGIAVVCGFIIGAPHDTLESSLADIDRVLALPVYFLSASILTPDVGTVEYLRARKTIPALRLLGDEGSHVNIKPRPEIFGTAPPYGMPTVCDALSKEELNELYELACCEFFLRETAFERIKGYTPPERMNEVLAWYEWTEQRAGRLANSARQEPVRERATALVAKSRSRSSWTAAPEQIRASLAV